MPHIVDPTDPRLDPYRDLKAGDTARGPCIAEGPLLVERLLQSRLTVLSVLIGERHASRFSTPVSAATAAPVHVVSEHLLHEVVGFRFHRGILAAAEHPTLPSARQSLASLRRDDVIVLCPEINSPENLGSIVRIAGGFGAAGVLLGPRCTDPFSRRALRVSMGSVLDVPLCASQDIGADMDWLEERGVTWWAAVCDDPDAESLAHMRADGCTGLVLGTEADGLDHTIAARCAHRVTIPMQNRFVDSLNVASAAGIFLFQMTQRRR